VMTCDETNCGVGLTSHGYRDASFRWQIYSWLSGAGARARKRRLPLWPPAQSPECRETPSDCESRREGLQCRLSVAKMPRITGETPEILTFDWAVETIRDAGSIPAASTLAFCIPLSPNALRRYRRRIRNPPPN
jgi:hypothetical protein